ncbi:MAG: ribonuclease H-like domain-containing protein, partial [Lachnospiraceae bacterium]|nr:ribonuclease H-like domain-containing protein [Lachnospiraceae bacterium]
MVNDYVVMDIETTGLNPKSEKIIELGAARIREGKVVDTFSAFVNPGRSLSDRIVELTGISDRDVENAPYIEEIIQDFVDFTGDDVLLGHNLSFDYSFVKKAAVN